MLLFIVTKDRLMLLAFKSLHPKYPLTLNFSWSFITFWTVDLSMLLQKSLPQKKTQTLKL